MKSGQGKLSERLRNAPHLLADEQYLKWVIEQVEELEKLEVFKIQRRPLHTPFATHQMGLSNKFYSKEFLDMCALKIATCDI